MVYLPSELKGSNWLVHSMAPIILFHSVPTLKFFLFEEHKEPFISVASDQVHIYDEISDES